MKCILPRLMVSEDGARLDGGDLPEGGRFGVFAPLSAFSAIDEVATLSDDMEADDDLL